ncbi:MAG: hypothetical protein QG657_1406, partial [Acidobacteriota bacterium]|nr:hypothetical protein [Acidobacteriota bacterium]
TFLEAIQRDAREQFGKCWPRFFAWERGQDPYIVDYGDDNVGYRPCKKPELARTHLIRVLNPLILNYLSRNPLAQHTLHLKVLNPYNGKALFEALRDLYKKRQNITIPGSIFLTALCDNKNHTLSAFDDAAEKRESEEIFKILPQRLQPACYYKKKPFGIQDWMNKKKQISNYKNDPEEIDKADICLAIDPYIDEYSISDSLMSDETGAGIDRYLEDYEKNKNSPKDGKNPLLERMAGVDRIYLRLAFESLSVMIANEGEERRRFDKSTISKERYVDLMKALLNSGVWAVLMDRDMNDYYAGECSDKLAKELNKKVKSYVDESGTGTAYLFIAPDEGDNSKSIGYIPNNLSENSSFTGWFDGTYRDFSQNEDFCRLYFRTERQFLIPLNLLPSWFHKALVEFPGANADENENADAEAEDLQQSPQRYILRLLFDMEKDQKNINLAADLWQLKKEKFSQVSSVGDKIDLAFLFTGDSNGMTGKAWLFNELKRRVLINTLHSLVANPYQSWFSALLRRWSDNNFIENKELLEARRLNDDNVKGNTSIGKIRFWELRLLSIYLLRLYSPYNDIDIDISREDKQVWMGFCDTLKKYCRDFLVDLKAHLMERNGELKPRHSFLNWYV